ncbi:hypothetical protein QFC20_002134 [Naganishia adeliensis]|uniref:Uncharacterized protein n=1 Tax=Naganishia adeliensis TaxID=92952 RepID=A0ACC2WMX5_9TREE|nr:hypothetical protein QFC20_002134 [Naganishia adeliensis]
MKFLQPSAIFNSFLGVLDIKSGAQIILLFGVLNKVAGVYGLLSAFTGGTIGQLSFYIYSTATLAVAVLGIRAVSAESSSKVLKLSHLYIVDHVIQTFYTLGFARHYWYEVPHDGRRVVNSQAQEDLIRLAVSRGEVSDKMPDNIAEIARGLWEKEEGTARVVLFLSWLIKIYFILVLYSYAAHLRSNTYHALPLSSSSTDPNRLSAKDQYASTAPAVPTHPPYEGSLDPRETGKRLEVLKESEEVARGEAEFHWDSEEDADESTRMNGAAASKGKGKGRAVDAE